MREELRFTPRLDKARTSSEDFFLNAGSLVAFRDKGNARRCDAKVMAARRKGHPCHAATDARWRDITPPNFRRLSLGDGCDSECCLAIVHQDVRGGESIALGKRRIKILAASILRASTICSVANLKAAKSCAWW